MFLEPVADLSTCAVRPWRDVNAWTRFFDAVCAIVCLGVPLFAGVFAVWTVIARRRRYAQLDL